MSTSLSERFLHPLGSSFLAQKGSGSEQHHLLLLTACFQLLLQGGCLQQTHQDGGKLRAIRSLCLTQCSVR